MTNEQQTTMTKIDTHGKFGGAVPPVVINWGKYVGEVTTIDRYEGFSGQYGPFLKVFSKIVDRVGGTDIVGSKIFNIIVDDNGTITWEEGKDLAVFLSEFGVTTPDQLIGKEIKLQTTPNKKDPKRPWLTFIPHKGERHVTQEKA